MKALIIVSDVVNNSVYKSVILRAADEVKAGGNISNVFGVSPRIPSIVTKMVRIGEETGKMNEMFFTANQPLLNQVQITD